MICELAFSVLLAQVLASPAAPSPLPAATGAASPQASAAPSAAPTRTPAPPGDAAIIVNTGSTNTEPYTIVVTPDRKAVVTRGGTTVTKELSRATTRWLFSHLAAAAPLERLRMRMCMKSASFGSSTTIAYRGHRTPDLSCGGDPAANELGRTASAIEKQLGIMLQLRQTRPAP
jgi:hypothetical protein